MKIALIGYGKMGRAIEAIAVERGHEIVLRIGIENLEDFTEDAIKAADVGIEFTGPESALKNISFCLKNKVSIVSGSTGWLQQYDTVAQLAANHKTGLLYASNFSLGVNIFFEINKMLARLMAPYTDYKASITEIHHTAKLDAPSGTAITLAEQILKENAAKTKWVNHSTGVPEELSIESFRIDPAPGTHTISYESATDTIRIEHEAHSRQGFALGAVLAAEFLAGKQGVYSMQDVLGLPR
jgi:4-hydroxy-tetrahydrodipicolinate reductase